MQIQGFKIYSYCCNILINSSTINRQKKIGFGGLDGFIKVQQNSEIDEIESQESRKNIEHDINNYAQSHVIKEGVLISDKTEGIRFDYQKKDWN